MTNNKEYSDKQEKTIANYLDWHQVTGSGARPLVTGDVESDKWLGECKTHTKPYQPIMFDSKILNKIVGEASAKFKQPAYFVDDGSQKIAHTWVMILTRDVSSNFVIKPYPYRVGNTISFSHVELMMQTPPHTLYSLDLGNYKVLLTPIDTFYALID